MREGDIMHPYWDYKRVMSMVALVLGVIGTMFIMWMFVSTVDVSIHNFNNPEEIGNWNIYKICWDKN